jgi:hypothetical protein
MFTKGNTLCKFMPTWSTSYALKYRLIRFYLVEEMDITATNFQTSKNYK